MVGVLVASGAAALLHEGAWFRLLVPVLGAGALPAAVVAAGALLGLALGSHLGGRLADRSRRPAQVLALAEVLGALLGLLVPPVLGAIHAALDGAAALGTATVLLAVAAVPWGASMPAAVRALAPPAGEVGRAFKRLYAWNTLGAVLGIAWSAAVLFEALGNRGTVRVAALLQGLAACAAFACARVVPAVAPPPGPVPARPPDGRRALLVLAAALAGAVGVGVQVAWMRRLTPLLGATFPVFASVLAVHLLGIAGGAALLGPRQARRPRHAVVALALGACAATALTPFLLGPVIDAVAAPWWRGYGDPLTMWGLRTLVAAVLVLPAVLPAAALLPWFVRLFDPGTRHAGRGSGDLVAANTLGGALGGLGVALWLVPAAGTAGALLVCAAGVLAAGALAVGRRVGGLGVLGAAAAAAVVLVGPPADRAGHDRVGALYSASAYRPLDVRTLLARDGRTAAVLVRDAEGRLEFWIEGSYEASTGPTDRLHLGLLGHLPLVLFRARTDRAPHVALIGLGAGFTAQAAMRYEPASLVVYELEEQVVHAAELFREAGGGLPAGAELVVADGRKAVLDGRRPLDVLSSDPVHPALGGSAYLYSVEYWRGALQRLSPEGLLVQWLPLYQLHVDDLRLVLRTFAAAVPHPYLFLAGPDALLVGTRTPLVLPLARLREVLGSEAAAPLRTEGLGSPGRLLALLALDRAGMTALAGDGDVNTDDRLLLELRSAWHERGDTPAAHDLLASRPPAPDALLADAPDAAYDAERASGERLAAALGSWARDLPFEALDRLAEIVADEPDHALARRLHEEAAITCAFVLLDEGADDAAAGLAREVAARGEADALLRLDAAEILIRAGAVEEGRSIAAPLASRHAWPRAHRLADGRW